MKDITEALREGVAHFRYEKSNGEIREAYGTLKTELIPDNQLPTGKKQKSRLTDTVSYYDIFSEGWRSFHLDNIVFVDENYGD